MKIGTQPRTRSYRKLTIVTAVLVAFGLAGAYAHTTGMVGAAACTVPTTDNGTATLSMNVQAASDYTVWTRIMVPDTTKNSINIEIDGNTCYSVGGSSAIAPNTWVWVNYQNGSTANVIRPTLSQGTHSIKYVGTNAGVMVDRIILASDATCTPTGTGDDCATGDATPPTTAITAPTANQNITGNTTLKATATDTSGIASVEFLVDGTSVGTSSTGSSPYSLAWNSATVTNGTHSVVVKATDKAGNSGTSSATSFNVTNSLPCSGNPGIPANLRSTSTSFDKVSLAWDASTPASGCVISGYNLYRDGTLVTKVASGTTYTDTGLSLNKSYNYTVEALDSTGHTSGQSTAVTVKTSSDTTAPSVPTGLASPLKTATQISLTWSASTDNVSVAGYYVYRNGQQVNQTTTASYTDTGLQPSTSYSYTVKAFDASGNTSAASTAASFSTIAGSGANFGDLNGDGTVNLSDLSILLKNWGKTGVPITSGDVNGDGTVNLSDLSALLKNWGKNV